MSGMTHEVSGKTKAEVYTKYQDEVEEGMGAIFLGHNPDPKDENLCLELMAWSPDGKEWILNYHWYM